MSFQGDTVHVLVHTWVLKSRASVIDKSKGSRLGRLRGEGSRSARSNEGAGTRVSVTVDR